jgi:Tfp pilus assembly protein PilE
MTCKKCGEIIPEDGKFCQSCGAEVEKSNQDFTAKKASGLQTAALVMGILGFFIPFITSLLAIIFGAITLKEKPNGKAVAGLTLGIISLLFIPILASMVLVSLSSARFEAHDAVIKSDLSQERINIEMYFSKKNSYKNYTFNPEIYTNIIANSTSQETPELKVNSEGSAYAIITTLNDKTEWCVDSTGYAGNATKIDDSSAKCIK